MSRGRPEPANWYAHTLCRKGGGNAPTFGPNPSGPRASRVCTEATFPSLHAVAILLRWFRWGRWSQEGGGDGAGDPGRPQDGDRGLGWWGDSGGGQEVSVQVEQLSPVKGPGAVAHAEPPGAPQMPGVQAPAGGEEVFQTTWFADRVADPLVLGTGGFTGDAGGYRAGTGADGVGVRRAVW